MERETGIEPATSSLGTCHFTVSTTLRRLWDAFSTLTSLAESVTSLFDPLIEVQTRYKILSFVPCPSKSFLKLFLEKTGLAESSKRSRWLQLHRPIREKERGLKVSVHQSRLLSDGLA
jgi:hypothetical protein